MVLESSETTTQSSQKKEFTNKYPSKHDSPEEIKRTLRIWSRNLEKKKFAVACFFYIIGEKNNVAIQLNSAINSFGVNPDKVQHFYIKNIHNTAHFQQFLLNINLDKSQQERSEPVVVVAHDFQNCFTESHSYGVLRTAHDWNQDVLNNTELQEKYRNASLAVIKTIVGSPQNKAYQLACASSVSDQFKSSSEIMVE